MQGEEMSVIWYRITVDDPKLSYGKPLSYFLGDALKNIALKVELVILYEVEGGGDPVFGITQLGGRAISVEELVERLQHTDQLDWATLCFIRNLDQQMV